MDDYDKPFEPGDQSLNPFQAPEFSSETVQTRVEFNPAPCPRCGSTDVRPAPYDAWYGRRAPKAIQDIICENCGANFNGENAIEYPPRTNPIVWILLTVFGFVAYIAFLIAAG